jgi:hypothetical protein
MKFITTPRIIGTILIIIAALSYFTGAQGAIGLGIAGIILIIAPKKHAQSMFDMLVSTFTKWKTIIITALYDALYWLLLFGAVYFLQWQLQIKALAAQSNNLITKEAIADPELVTQSASTLQGFVYALIIGGLLAILFSLLIYSISRALIWTTITKQKLNKKFFLKFLTLNSLWWLIWLPVFAIIAVGTQASPDAKGSLVVILLLASYFTPILHTLYMQKHLIGYSIGNGIAWGIAKVHRLIVPYTFAFVIYVIAYQLFRIARDTAYVKPASMLFVVLFIAWLRIYLYGIIKDFK